MVTEGQPRRLPPIHCLVVNRGQQGSPATDFGINVRVGTDRIGQSILGLMKIFWQAMLDFSIALTLHIRPAWPGFRLLVQGTKSRNRFGHFVPVLGGYQAWAG